MTTVYYTDVVLEYPIGVMMRFREMLVKINSYSNSELLSVFDDVAYTLGFDVEHPTTPKRLDTEAALSLLPFLLQNSELRLTRFASVTFTWLERYHSLLNPQKLYKMSSEVERRLCGGEAPFLQLFNHFLWKVDPERFSKFEPRSLSKPYYLNVAMKRSTDVKLETDGFFNDLDSSINLMVPSGAFRMRASDVMEEAEYLAQNNQLRLRLLLGVNNRTDALWLLREMPTLSASELADTLMLSYEPANRFWNEFKRVSTYSYSF